jgi:hypothetical protein
MALLLAACGGGGGGSGPLTTPPDNRPVATKPGANAGLPGTDNGGGSTTPLPPPIGTQPGGGVVTDPAVGANVDPDPGESASVAAFSQTVYPIATQYCVACHDLDGRGSLDFAQTNVTAAHDLLINNQKVDLSAPDDSRLVERLVEDQHFCWNECGADGTVMRDAIAQWATLIGMTPGAPPAPKLGEIISGPANLASADMTGPASGVIAQWNFREGSGAVVSDSSGVAPPLDLTLSGATEWLADGGLEMKGGKAAASSEISRKLYDRIATGANAAGQFSVEAWITPSNVTQDGPARIVSYSSDSSNRNFALTESTNVYSFRNRSTATGITTNGNPSLDTAAGTAKAAQQHVVLTFAPRVGRRIYVDGKDTGLIDPQGYGPLTNWDATSVMLLGNEVADNRPWLGKLHYVAIYERALDASEVARRFAAGAAGAPTLKFDISNLLDTPNSYIAFEVSDFDKSSYLFANPVLVTPNANNQHIKGIRIAVNNRAQASAQVYSTLDTRADLSPKPLSRLATIIAKDLGPREDQFTLLFEIVGDKQNIAIEPISPVTPDTSVIANVPQVGIRTFEQINNTMAILTGVDPNRANVNDTFIAIKQQLPGSPDIRGFLSSQQVGIFKLALEYCDSMVDTTALRDAFFGNSPAFEFAATPDVAFSTQAKKDVIVNNLLNKMLGINLSNQPSPAEAQPVLNGLINDLTRNCAAGKCDAARTRTVVKAACSTTLSSAAMLIQ